MSAKRGRRSAAEPSAAIVTEKHVDATDEEQSSDDEAPEEVSAAAATALAGRRRKAEQQARQAAPAPKRKRARSSSKGGKNAFDGDANAVAGGGGGLVGGGGLELPSDLLLKVKSGGLQRMEADVLAAREMKEQAEAESATALSAGRRVKKRAGDVPRSDNFQLVVLDEEDGEVGDGAGSKPVATENARKFLRDRLGSRKRVSYSLLKARKRLGPSPNF